jgi:taurine dioxygenase
MSVESISNDPSSVVAMPLQSGFGAEVSGVDVAQAISDEAFARILDHLHRYRVIYFRQQKITPVQLARFGARFGELEVHHLPDHLMRDLPQVRVISNEVKDGKEVGAARAGMYWHSDLSYKTRPALATLLYCVECPPVGGNTLFADMVRAYTALPGELKAELLGRTTIRDRSYRYNEFYPNRPPLTPQQIAAVPPVEHPAVRVHPVTKELALYISAGSCSHIVGMGIERGRKLLRELEEFATQSRFVYSHAWQKGDLVVWDNRTTLHCATPCDPSYRRTMQRVQAIGEQPITA